MAGDPADIISVPTQRIVNTVLGCQLERIGIAVTECSSKCLFRYMGHAERMCGGVEVAKA